MSIIAGIDVGGTFTDLIWVDNASGEVRLAKVPTTVENQAYGVLSALAEARVSLNELDEIIHGTTTTTNAMLERRLAKVGLITTRGFRDVLELGRRTRPEAYGLKGRFIPLIPRNLRLEVKERMDAKGQVLIPLNINELDDAIKTLISLGCEAVVVHFLHSYVNPAHERQAVEQIKKKWHNPFITAGHTLISEYREYERGVTAAVNASVQPILSRYIERLQTELSEQGFRRDLLVMQGNGGTASANTIVATAVNTVMSGPASGVIAAAGIGLQCGIPNLITYDMGGTSSDVALIREGMPEISSELEIEYAMPIHVPMVDVHTIGAGGGSLAVVNAAGILCVGPMSAGATPGPICYARGGTEPTITDANVVLGRLSLKKMFSVDRPVPIEQVRQGLLDIVGIPLGLDAETAAAAILRIANDKMAGAIRMISLGRGHDPRDFALFAFGGAGPLHACALARELGIPKVLIPARPGLTNALGCVMAHLRHDFVHTLNRVLNSVDDGEIVALFSQQIEAGKKLIAEEQVSIESLTSEHRVDMQFQGQSHVLTVHLESHQVTKDMLLTLFQKAYYQRFGVELGDIPPILVNLHTAVLGIRKPVNLESIAAMQSKPSLREAEIEKRPVWFEGYAWVDTPIYRKEWLPVGAEITGPAIIEQFDCTTVLDPQTQTTLDNMGNLLISLVN